MGLDFPFPSKVSVSVLTKGVMGWQDTIGYSARRCRNEAEDRDDINGKTENTSRSS
jgi:hypothetical protein